jgi:hypothetical protein
MALWGNLDASNNAPVFADTGGWGVTANTQDSSVFGNVMLSATVTGIALGVFGVDTTEANSQFSSGDGRSATHAGWVLRQAGAGPIVSITANAAAVGSNSTISFTGGGTGNTPGAAVVAVNAAGYIQSVTVTTPGLYTSTPTANAMSNAVFTITMGGRAGRVNQETLVAMGSIYGDATASDDTQYPDS